MRKLGLMALSATVLAGCASDGSGVGGGGGSDPSVQRPPRLAEPAQGSSAAAYLSAEYNNSNGLSLINAAEGYAARTTGEPGGAGARIAIIDTGIDLQHPEFDNAELYVFEDFGIPDSTIDTNGHGTHVAGTAAARRDGEGVHGVAYNAQPVAIKLFRDVPTIIGGSIQDPNVSFSTDAAVAIYSAAGISTAVRRRDLSGNVLIRDGQPIDTQSAPAAESDVMNMSFGVTADPNDEILRAMTAAAGEDKIMVAALGNSSISGPSAFPAAHMDRVGVSSHSIAVAALDGSGTSLAGFSNSCGSLAQNCLSAPGEAITSTTPTQNTSGFGVKSGTSMASPHVAGAAALATAAFPGVSGDDIVDRMFATADDLGAPGVDTTFGHGRLNVEALLSPVGVLSVPTGATVGGASVSASSFSAVAGPGTSTMGLIAATDGMMALDALNAPFAFEGASVAVSTVRATPLQDHLSETADVVAAASPDGRLSFTGYQWAGATEDPYFQPALENRNDRPWERRDGENLGASVEMALSETATFSYATSASVQPQSGSTHFAATSGGPLGARLGGVEAAPFAGGGEQLSFIATPSDGLALEASFHQGDGYAGDAQTETLSFGMRQTFGRFEVGARASQIDEDGAIAGAQFDGFASAASADTVSIGVDVAAKLTHNVTLSAGYALASTRGATAADDILTVDSQLSDSASIALSFGQVLRPADRLTFIAALPFASIDSNASLATPIGRTEEGGVIYENRSVDLSPSSREKNLSAIYATRIGESTFLDMSAYTRLDADHVEGETDLGAALRIRWNF